MDQESNIIYSFLQNNYTRLAKIYKMEREKFSQIIEPIRDGIKQEDTYRNGKKSGLLLNTLAHQT